MGHPKLGMYNTITVLGSHFIFNNKTTLKLQQRNESYGGVLFVGGYVSQSQNA